MTLKYAIGAIGWYNFEKLVQTLLKGLIGAGVTSFGGSKDGGRDAAYTGEAAFPSEDTRWAGSWIFQVKYVELEQGTVVARRQLKSTFGKELKMILARRSEATTPDNYVLISDVPLTAHDRDDFDTIARKAGYSGNLALIDGLEICQLLDLFPQVRRSYPQLLGLADLDHIMNRDLYARSEAYVSFWQPCLSTFVRTEAYERALAVLGHHHFAVLDGAPEAGKSTIAAAIALYYATEGYEVIDLRHPEQVYRIIAPDCAQVFIADDAVGSVALDPSLTDSWSRDLAGILRKLDAKHLLIWTARSYVLEEAIAESRLGEVARDFPGIHEVLVEVGKLSQMQKAEILYNHAKKANLSDSSRILIRENAGKVVAHPNYTPERIRQLVEHVLPKQTSSGEPSTGAISWEDVERFLRDPGTRWVQAYRNLSASERALLSAMLDFRGRVSLKRLETAYLLHSKQLERPRLRFDECVNRLKHSFLRTGSAHAYEYLDFQHPSLRDMLLSELQEDEGARCRYLELASPIGISNLIRAISMSLHGRGQEHTLLPSNDHELSILLGRITDVSKGVLQISDWNAILSAAEMLLPRDSDMARLAPAEAELRSFGNSWGGKVLKAVVDAFGFRDTYEQNQRYQLAQWTSLLEKYYDLAVYLTPPPEPEYVVDLAMGLAEADPQDAIAFASLVRNHQPPVIRQTVNSELMTSWDTYLRDWLDELIAAGEGFPVREDYEGWEDDYNPYDE